MELGKTENQFLDYQMSFRKTLVILAGGLGSRFKGLKQIEGITNNNSPILEYSIFDACEAGFNKIVLVLNKNIPLTYLDRLKEISTSKNIEIDWIFQEITDFVPADYELNGRSKPWGTGHALLCAKKLVDSNFVVINGDDFYGKKIYKKAASIIDEQMLSKEKYHIIAYPLQSTLSENGSVSRGICEYNSENHLTSIFERTEIFSDGNSIYYLENNQKYQLQPETLVSMNFSVFHPSFFDFLELQFQKFIDNQPKMKEEFYIPVQIQKSIDDGKVSVTIHQSPSKWMGITYPDDKLTMKLFLEEETNQKKYPADLWK